MYFASSADPFVNVDVIRTGNTDDPGRVGKNQSGLCKLHVVLFLSLHKYNLLLKSVKTFVNLDQEEEVSYPQGSIKR